MKKLLTAVFAFSVFFFCNFGFAAKYSADQEQGFEAYRKNDWTSAIFFLRKAGSSGYDAESLYMLVMSEINAGEYKDALSDAMLFTQKFPESHYFPYIQFQRGKILHFLGRSEDAVLVLSDFCHQYSDSELYASALYWIAECFYAEYNFDSARSLYERVVIDFPSDSKANDCRYRLEMIAQREREEKLIYLLKVTGEENLSAREEYERQIKLYQTQDKLGLRKSLGDAQTRIMELESLLEEQKELNTSLQAKLASAAEKGTEKTSLPETVSAPAADSSPVQTVSEPKKRMTDPEIEALKQKAGFLKYLLDDQQ